MKLLHDEPSYLKLFPLYDVTGKSEGYVKTDELQDPVVPPQLVETVGVIINETNVFAGTVRGPPENVNDISVKLDELEADSVLDCVTPLTIRAVVDVGEVPDDETSLNVMLLPDETFIHISTVVIK